MFFKYVFIIKRRFYTSSVSVKSILCNLKNSVKKGKNNEF